MADSTASTPAAPAPSAHVNKFWWFHGASVVALTERLTACDPGTARLEVRVSADDKMTFRVMPAATTVAALTMQADPPADINDSHLCPPICPG